MEALYEVQPRITATRSAGLALLPLLSLQFWLADDGGIIRSGAHDAYPRTATLPTSTSMQNFLSLCGPFQL